MSINETMNSGTIREDDSSAVKILNWIVLAITLLVLAYFAVYLPSNRAVVENVVKNFRTDISSTTKLVMAVPSSAFPIVALVLTGVVVALQRFSQSRALATCVHALVTVVCCIAIMLVHDAMDQPIIDLMRAVSSH